MVKIVEGKEYLNTTEVMTEFSAPRKRFYDNIKPQLRTYHFDAKKSPWYSKDEVIALKMGNPLRKASLTLAGGIQKDWTKYLVSQGYNATTVNNEIKIVSLPDEVVEAFGLSPDKQYIQRERMTLVDRVPICVWSTYYPVEFVGDVLDQMKMGTVENIVEHIKDAHGVIIGYSKERYSARITTFEEQTLFQSLREEPVLILQRLSYTSDKSVLVLYSNMVLLGDWFTPEHDYVVGTWDK